MRKKGICRILALVLSIGIFVPFLAFSVHSEGSFDTGVAAESATGIREQIRAYAKSINQSKADETAAMALATHGITMGGRDFSVGEDHALTATLYNSELMMEALTQACTRAIEYMYDTGISSMPYMTVAVNWDWNGPESNWYAVRNYISDYWFYPGIFADIAGVEQSYRDFWLTVLIEHYGTINSYDESLTWMAGYVWARLSIERTAVTGSEATYQVTCSTSDIFDFDTASNSGFRDLISAIGQVMFREFTWESTISFTLTVPNSCDHGTNAYRWSYDASTSSMTSHSDSGYTCNAAETNAFLIGQGNTLYYYDLAEGVMLRHDRNWVLEMDAKDGKQIFLTPAVYQASQTQPSLYLIAGHFLHFYKAYYTEKDDYFKEYCGVSLNGLYTYSSATTYTYRLENQVNADGSNMVYLTVLDKATGAVVLEKTAMDDFYTEAAGEQKTLVSEDSNWISGQDFCIRYFGNSSFGFRAQEFELRVWENGEDGEVIDYYEATSVTAPTCTEEGYTTYTCSDCGHNYRDEFVPSLGGHIFGEWYTAVAPGCETEGVLRRDCATCGGFESQPIAATGHDFALTEVVAPTCREQGYTRHLCQCGAYFDDEFVDATGHILGDWVTSTEPTCTEGGQMERCCLYCEYSEFAALGPKGHRYENGICKRCGEADPEAILMGDVNADGVINHLDAMLAAQVYVGLVTEYDLAVVDVNGDGIVNHLDAMLIAQFYVGVIGTFEQGGL